MKHAAEDPALEGFCAALGLPRCLLARFCALSPQALAQAWRSTEALRLRWGPVSAWGITASPTVEHWFAWLEEAENLALASFPAAEKLARLPTPAADAEEFVSKQDVFAAELDVSLLCEEQTCVSGRKTPETEKPL